MIPSRLLTATVVLSASLSLPLKAEPRILSERFDDWFYRCVESEEGEKKTTRCEVVQIAQTKQGEQTVNLLTLSLSEGSENKKKNTVLTVLAPLNVYLPAGVALSVDEGKAVTLTYRNCNNAGCWLQHLVTDKFLGELKGGQSGFAKFRLINGQNLNIKFSLKGLPAALKSLQDGKPPKEKS
jgi:invasion protein IalB